MTDTMEPAPLPSVYQLRVVVRGVSPLIWRRLLIPADTTIAGLHAVLQIAFGWGGEHLHRFLIHGVEYGISYPGGVGFRDDPHRVHVTELGLLHADDDTRTVLREVFTLNREALAPDTVGLQLQEAKDLLAAVQDTLVDHQVTTALSALVACPDCGIPRRHKDSRRIVVRTVFGTLRLVSPRWWACPCTPRTARTFSPLASVLRERTTPEMSYLQARFAGLVSYGLSADLLGEILPLGRVLHATTVRRQVQATAQRLEDELGDERPGFITGCPADWAELPRTSNSRRLGLLS